MYSLFIKAGFERTHARQAFLILVWSPSKFLEEIIDVFSQPLYLQFWLKQQWSSLMLAETNEIWKV